MVIFHKLAFVPLSVKSAKEMIFRKCVCVALPFIRDLKFKKARRYSSRVRHTCGGWIGVPTQGYLQTKTETTDTTDETDEYRSSDTVKTEVIGPTKLDFQRECRCGSKNVVAVFTSRPA